MPFMKKKPKEKMLIKENLVVVLKREGKKCVTIKD